MTQEKSRGLFKFTQLSRAKFTLNLGLEVSWLLAWCPYHSPLDPPCSESPKVGPHLEAVDGEGKAQGLSMAEQQWAHLSSRPFLRLG